MLEAGLLLIVLLVLVLPITVHAVEKNIEAFLFLMGAGAVTLVHFLGEPLWSVRLAQEALREPVMITAAVLIVGLLVHAFQKTITGTIVGIEKLLGPRWFCFFLVIVLGVCSSVITAIMAAIILVETVGALRLNKNFETKLVILGCFSIGLGAALTPIGEPLSTLCVAKLRGEPYHADFFFLLRHLGYYIVPGILAIGGIGYFLAARTDGRSAEGLEDGENKERLVDIVVRAAKVYLFIMALILLSAGFKPIIDRYIVTLPGAALYWINTVSAIMDNATLTAAEISPRMSLLQIQAVLMGLLIAGGMLIPGNIPNIIAAGRLRISSKAWAKLGVPLGFAIMIIYFIIFEIVG